MHLSRKRNRLRVSSHQNDTSFFLADTELRSARSNNDWATGSLKSVLSHLADGILGTDVLARHLLETVVFDSVVERQSCNSLFVGSIEILRELQIHPVV